MLACSSVVSTPPIVCTPVWSVVVAELVVGPNVPVLAVPVLAVVVVTEDAKERCVALANTTTNSMLGRCSASGMQPWPNAWDAMLGPFTRSGKRTPATFVVVLAMLGLSTLPGARECLAAKLRVPNFANTSVRSVAVATACATVFTHARLVTSVVPSTNATREEFANLSVWTSVAVASTVWLVVLPAARTSTVARDTSSV
jgi:hypothetical protein